MARFSAYRLTSGLVGLDCQSDLLSYFETRLIVPLLPVNEVPRSIERLHPVLDVDGERLVMATHLASAVPVREIGRKICSLNAHEYEISAALDVLITGI
jgi:toxin CcdB